MLRRMRPFTIMPWVHAPLLCSMHYTCRQARMAATHVPSQCSWPQDSEYEDIHTTRDGAVSINCIKYARDTKG